MTSPSVSLQDASNVIAPVILSILRTYTQHPPVMQKYLRDSIDWMIRELPICATFASVRAIEAAASIEITTLKDFWWHHQPRYDKGRKVLHWEHVFPVSDLRNALIRLDHPTVELVSEILQKYEIAWITKDENGSLKRFNRSDPREEYRLAGIELTRL